MEHHYEQREHNDHPPLGGLRKLSQRLAITSAERRGDLLTLLLVPGYAAAAEGGGRDPITRRLRRLAVVRRWQEFYRRAHSRR